MFLNSVLVSLFGKNTENKAFSENDSEGVSF